MNTPDDQDSGFSTIEALAAVLLLSITILPIYSMISQVFDATRRTENMIQARQAISSGISLFRSGVELPATISGWDIRLDDEEYSMETAADGYLGGQYFKISSGTYTITASNTEFSFTRSFRKSSIEPIYESEEDAIYSNF